MTGETIPAAAYTPLLRVAFGMAAVRRGPHWQLQTIGGVDEGEMLADALAGVLKHVPIPTKELGLVSDLTTCAMAFYSAIGSRVQIDRLIAQQIAAAPPQARPMPPVPSSPPPGGDVTAADLLDGMPVEPLRAVADQPDPGHRQARTAGLGDGEDPEPVLFETFRPGETPATVEQLVAAADGNGRLLDRLAPPIEVDGRPASTGLEGPA